MAPCISFSNSSRVIPVATQPANRRLGRQSSTGWLDDDQIPAHCEQTLDGESLQLKGSLSNVTRVFNPGKISPKQLSLIARYVEGVSKREFFRGHVAARCRDPKNPDNRKSCAALSHQLLSNMPDFPAKEARGMRNILVHDYGGVNIGRVWDTAVEDIPVLRAAVEKYLKPRAGKRRPKNYQLSILPNLVKKCASHHTETGRR